MARYTGPRVRVSRRIGFNVFENRKGDKALQDRPYPPGENGRKRARETDYGTQLKEKQKVRYMYGVLEKQFRNYYKDCLLYTSPSPRDATLSRMPSSA